MFPWHWYNVFSLYGWYFTRSVVSVYLIFLSTDPLMVVPLSKVSQLTIEAKARYWSISGSKPLYSCHESIIINSVNWNFTLKNLDSWLLWEFSSNYLYFYSSSSEFLILWFRETIFYISLIFLLYGHRFLWN